MSEIYSKYTTSTDPRPMYNGGLRTRGIDTIVAHHNATTSKIVALNTWTITAGNYTSAHYEITDDEIIGAIGENYVAYHAGGTGGADVPRMDDPNGRSIGLEHVNSSGAPDWEVSDATLRNSAKLIADICKRYNLPIDRSTIKLHREITSTACPGGLDIDKLVRYAKEASGQNGGNTPSPAPQPSPARADQVLTKGSTVKIPGVFSLDDLIQDQNNSNNWYAVTNLLAIAPVDDNNWIPVGPLTETDVKGKATSDQDFSNAGHSYFTFSEKTFRVMDVDAGTDSALVNIDGRAVWMKAGPLVEL